VILRTDLESYSCGGCTVLPDSYLYVAVIFPRFEAAASLKTDLMSELEFLQLLAELDEEGLVLPDLYTVHSCQNS
jgi:hypothetical protein